MKGVILRITGCLLLPRVALRGRMRECGACPLRCGGCGQLPGAACRHGGFQAQQSALPLQPPAIASQPAVAANDPVAGDDQRHRIGSAGAGHRPGAARIAQGGCQACVGKGLPERNRLDPGPDGPLKRRSARIEGEGQIDRFSLEKAVDGFEPLLGLLQAAAEGCRRNRPASASRSSGSRSPHIRPHNPFEVAAINSRPKGESPMW